MRFNDGVYVDDLIVYYEEGSTDMVVARGYRIQLPDVVGVSPSAVNAVHMAMEQALLGVGEDYRMQFRFGLSCEYGEALERYTEADRGLACSRWGELTRAERFSRYDAAAAEGEIRREVFMIYVSTLVPKISGLKATVEGARKGFEIVDGSIKGAFSMGKVEVCDEIENFREMHSFFNPSLRGPITSARRETLSKLYAPELSLLDNSMRSDGDADMRGKASFTYDGQYYRIFRIEQWPTRIDATVFRALVSDDFDTFQIVANLDRAKAADVEKAEEKARKRIMGAGQFNGEVAQVQRVEESERLIRALSSGEVVPYNVTYMIFVWASSEQELLRRSAEVQTTLEMISGLRADKINRPRAASEFMSMAMPGNVFRPYMKKVAEPALHNFAAALLPRGASGHGHLDDADALYDSPGRKIFGVQLFAGGSPRHGVVVGGTGSGKSCFVGDLISQASVELDRIVVVDEGNSHGAVIRALGGTSVVVRPDSGVVINYLDTFGLPLMSSHISTAKAFLTQMVGPEIVRRNAGIDGYFGRIVAGAYQSKADEWLKYNDEAGLRMCVIGAGLRSIMEQASISKQEAWGQWMEVAGDWDAENQWLDGLGIELSSGAARLATEDGYSDALSLAYTAMGREQMPTHSDLVDSMLLEDDVFFLVETLGDWKNGGSHGSLFDGASTVNLGERVIHLEMGEIPESDKKLKALAMFAVQSLVRDSILAEGRQGKKLVIFEELARLAAVEGVAEIVSEGYAQLRKHGCAVLTVFQQFSQVANTWLGDVLAGNTATWYLMRQQSETEVTLIRDKIGIPEDLAAQVRRFPMAGDLPAGNRYSMVCVFGGNTEGSENGILIHVAAPEMLAATSTDGVTFEGRKGYLERAIGGDAVIDAIFEFTHNNETR